MNSGRKGRSNRGRRATRPASGPGSVVRLRRRETRRRRLRLVALGAVALAAALAAAWFLWLRDLDRFAIEEVRITGLEEVRADDGTDRAEADKIRAAIEASLSQMTTFHPREGDLEQALGRFPRVSGVELETDFPNSAVVSLDLRQDGSIIGEGERAVLIATDGTVLGPASDATKTTTTTTTTTTILPAITGDPPVPGTDRLQGPDLAQALVLGSVPREIRPFVVRTTDGARGVEVELSNGLVLVFGDDSDAGAKWRASATVIADPELFSATEIDVTVPDRPAVSFGQ